MKPIKGETKSQFVKRNLKDETLITISGNVQERMKYLAEIYDKSTDVSHKDTNDAQFYIDLLADLETDFKGEKGDKGEPGIEGKDGYTPIKGVDYFDGLHGKDGRDGKDGKDGINGKDGRDGKDGKDGVTTVIYEEEQLSPKDIKDRLESLKGDKRLDASAIKNLPKNIVKVYGGAGSGTSGGVSSVNGQIGDVTLTTSNIAEGTNLYYTNERVDDRVATLLVAGTNITSLVYDDTLGTLTINAATQTTSPGGSNKQFQVNNAGVFDGTTGVEYQLAASPNVLITAQNAAYTALEVTGVTSQSVDIVQFKTATQTTAGVTSAGFLYSTNPTYAGSTIIGRSITLTEASATAIGEQSTVTGRFGTAIGYQAQATGIDSTAIGYQAIASGANSLAIGIISQATNTNSMAFGRNAIVTGFGSIAIGNNLSATQNGQVLMGSNITNTVVEGIAIGSSISIAGGSSISIGAFSSVGSSGDSCLVIGRSASANAFRAMSFGAFVTNNYQSIIMAGSDATTANAQFVVGGNGLAITDMYLGRGVTNATASNISIQPNARSGTNVNGGNFTLRSGNSTGTGTGGYFRIETPSTGTTGTATNSFIERVQFNGGTNGGVVFNETGADYDLRIEGDTDANLVFVDASTDRLGVGLNNPAYKLDVNGDINLPAASAYYVGGTAGVSGTFTTADLKTVTVTKGIITSIV